MSLMNKQLWVVASGVSARNNLVLEAHSLLGHLGAGVQKG
jgi:hypothetical protein